MTEFEKLTASPQALAAFLRGLSVIEAPWDAAFKSGIARSAPPRIATLARMRHTGIIRRGGWHRRPQRNGGV